MNLAVLLFFVAGALILLEPVQAEDPLTLSGGGSKAQESYVAVHGPESTSPSNVNVHPNNEVIVKITHDGKIIPNSKYPPDENAKRFIEAVQRTWPQMCVSKGRYVEEADTPDVEEADTPAIFMDEGMGDHWP